MTIAIPYKHQTGIELKYCLRSIELFIKEPEVVIIGDKPEWVKNVTHIPFKDNQDLKYKERNIFQKLLLMQDDFIYFNDDHFLLKPFDYRYRFSGKLSERINAYKPTNDFRITVQNTFDVFGDIPNYYRHEPVIIERDLLEKLQLDWNKEWGYCIKSIYCHLNNIEGDDFPDLKIREPLSSQKINKLFEGKPCFSTEEFAMSHSMIHVLDNLYPLKSQFEI